MGRLGRAVDWDERFTPEEATKAIFGSDGYEVVEAYDIETGELVDCCKFHGVALQFFNCLLQEIVQEEQTFRFILGLEQIPNPLNALSKYEARFTRLGFYSWWLANPRGVPCPEWFKDLAELDGIKVGQLPPPIEELERKRERRKIEREATWIYRRDRDRLLEQNERLREQLRQLKHRAKKGTPQTEAPDDQAIIEGLTVADVRRMCERSGAFASVLRAVAQWHAIGNENPERMTKESLEAGLKIAARKDGWGTDKGELAEKSQAEPLRKMILGEWRQGGRPRKNSND